MDAAEALADLWSIVGGAHSSLTRVTLTGEEPALPSSFKIGTTAQATIAAAALMASEIWRQRTDRDRRWQLACATLQRSFEANATYESTVSRSLVFVIPSAEFTRA